MSSPREIKSFLFFKPKDEKEPIIPLPSEVQRFFAEKFNAIRADDDKERGNCLMCARESINVLMNKEYKPKVISDSNAEFDEDFLDSALSKKKFSTLKEGNITKFIEYLKSDKHPAGSVFLADTEDHVYVIFKSFEKDLFIIDSDAHYYGLITNSESFRISSDVFLKDFSPEKLESSMSNAKEYGYYNYFFDSEEDSIRVFHIGQADISWKNLKESMLQNRDAPAVKHGFP